MLSINMRIFKTVLLIASFGASVRCLPIVDEITESKNEVTSVPHEADASTAVSTPTYTDTTDYYDQRQNGTENYRIHVDGVVLVLAPVEALLLAGAAGSAGIAITTSTTEPNLSLSDLDGSQIQSSGESNKTSLSQVLDLNQNKTEPAISKMIQKPALRLANFLAPLIRRIRYDRSTSVH